MNNEQNIIKLTQLIKYMYYILNAFSDAFVDYDVAVYYRWLKVIRYTKNIRKSNNKTHTNYSDYSLLKEVQLSFAGFGIERLFLCLVVRVRWLKGRYGYSDQNVAGYFSSTVANIFVFSNSFCFQSKTPLVGATIEKRMRGSILMRDRRLRRKWKGNPVVLSVKA